MRVAVAGSGAWGAAFASAIGGDICFWSRNADSARNAALQNGGEWRAELQDAAQDADLIIVAVSSGGFESVLHSLKIFSAPILWLTKGFAKDGRLLSEAAAEILPPDAIFGALSGPTFAAEVARGLPAAMVAAVNRPQHLPHLHKSLHRKMLRVYPSADLIGVCAAGALKNVIAIAAGIGDGLQLGANARAAIITRGLAEIAAFNRAAGGEERTLSGIAGIGDLLLTCTSDLSRNRQYGLALGGGIALPQLTVEGVPAAAAAQKRCREMRVDAPIIAATCAVLHQGESPRRAAEMLLSRPPPESECAGA